MTSPQRRKSPHKCKAGPVRIWRALLYSIAGLYSAFRHESAFRQELALATVLIAVAVALPANLVQMALLINAVLLVLVVELLNSAVEATVDRISFDDHALAKRAKDIGSAAVFVSLVGLRGDLGAGALRHLRVSAGRQPEAIAPSPIGLRSALTVDGTASRQVSSTPATGDRNVRRAIVGPDFRRLRRALRSRRLPERHRVVLHHVEIGRCRTVRAGQRARRTGYRVCPRTSRLVGLFQQLGTDTLCFHQ